MSCYRGRITTRLQIYWLPIQNSFHNITKLERGRRKDGLGSNVVTLGLFTWLSCLAAPEKQSERVMLLYFGRSTTYICLGSL